MDMETKSDLETMFRVMKYINPQVVIALNLTKQLKMTHHGKSISKVTVTGMEIPITERSVQVGSF